MGGFLPWYDPEEYWGDVKDNALAGADWLFNSSPLKPVSDWLKEDEDRKRAARALVPGYSGLETIAGGISGLGALIGSGMNLDPSNPEKFRTPDWDLVRKEAGEGIHAGLETIAPIDIATAGASGLSSIKGLKALAPVARALDTSEGLYGAGQVAHGLGTGDYGEAGIGLVRSAGGVGSHFSPHLGRSLELEPSSFSAGSVVEAPSLPNYVSAMSPEGRGFLPDEVFGETLTRPRPPYSILAEHGTPTRSWFDRGESPSPSQEGAYGAGLYASQITGEAPGYARVRSSALLNHPDLHVEKVRGEMVPLKGDPLAIKANVHAEKPLFLDEEAPRDLRMKAMIELNNARRGGVVDPERADFLKGRILKPETTADDLMYIATELVRDNIPREARASYKGDPYSDFIKSAGYDLWQTGKRGEPAKEVVIPDPRRQFKAGEHYDPRTGNREVLADTSGEPVPPIESGVTMEELELSRTRPDLIPSIADRLGMTVRQFNEARYQNDIADRRRWAEEGTRDLDANLPYFDNAEISKPVEQSLSNPSLRVSEAPDLTSPKPLAAGIGSKSVSIGKQVESLDGKLKGTIVKIPNSFSNDKHVRVQWDNGINGTISISNLREPTVKPINIGDWIEGTAKDLGWKPDPFSGTRSKMVEGGGVPPSKPVLSPNADALKSILKRTKIKEFTPESIISTFEKAGLEIPPDLKARLPEFLGELEGAGLVTREGDKFTIPTTRTGPVKSPMGRDMTLPEQLGTKNLSPEDASLIDSIKQDILSRPVRKTGDMFETLVSKMEEGGTPTQPPSSQPPRKHHYPPPEGEKGKPITYTVTLNDGTSHPVKARSVEEAQNKAEEILASHGSKKQVTQVKEKISSLERAAQSEVNEPEIKKLEELTQEQAKEEIKKLSESGKVATQAEKDRIRELDKISKAQDAEELKLRNEELRQVEHENRLREKAHEKELRDQLKVEEDFKKAQERAKKKEARTKFQLEKKVNESSLAMDILNLPKTLLSSIDISYPLRQGLFLLNRSTGRTATLKGLKSVKESSHLATKLDLSSRKNADLYKKSGLNQISYDPTTDVNAISEQFPSKFAESIPLVKQSQRIYNDQSNLMRADLFDEMTAKWSKEGKTPEKRPDLYAGYAKYLNVLTGRDPLPKSLAKAGEILNATFWSPQFVKSRLQILNPKFYWDLPPEVQKMALRDVGGTLATLATALGAVSAVAQSQGLDVKVEGDLRHTNFGKLKVGEHTYDFFSGLLPIIRTAARIGTSRQITEKGEYNLKGGLGKKDPRLKDAPFGRSAASEIGGFVEGKTSPAYQISKGILSGEDYYGGEYNLDDFLSDLGEPMGIGDIREGGLAGIPSLLGVGYGNLKSRERSRQAEGIPSTKKKGKKALIHQW